MNFGAGNFRGRRPGTSALRMLLRLTAVKLSPSRAHFDFVPFLRPATQAIKMLEVYRLSIVRYTIAIKRYRSFIFTIDPSLSQH